MKQGEDGLSLASSISDRGAPRARSLASASRPSYALAGLRPSPGRVAHGCLALNEPRCYTGSWLGTRVADVGIAHSIRLAVLCALITPASITTTCAQICSSFASFGRGTIRLTAGGTFSDGGYGGLGGLVVGTGSVWVGGGISIRQLDARDDLSVGGSAGGGLQFPLDQDGVVELCPVFGLSKSSVQSGLAVGVVAAHNGAMRLIPSATIESVYSREIPVGETTAVSDIWGRARVKLGVVYGDVITLRWSADVPFGGDDVRARSTVLLGVHFWTFR